MAVTDLDPEVAAERERILNEQEAAGGGRREDHVVFDFFGAETFVFMLPDGAQFIEHKKLMEGDLRKIRNGTNREVTLTRTTKEARVKLAAGEDRASLLDAAITGWHILKGGIEFPYTERNKRTLLESGDPKIFDDLVKDINAKNPSLRGDVTVEDIDEQMAELETMRAELLKDEGGKGSS